MATLSLECFDIIMNEIASPTQKTENYSNKVDDFNQKLKFERSGLDLREWNEFWFKMQNTTANAALK